MDQSKLRVEAENFLSSGFLMLFSILILRPASIKLFCIIICFLSNDVLIFNVFIDEFLWKCHAGTTVLAMLLKHL